MALTHHLARTRRKHVVGYGNGIIERDSAGCTIYVSRDDKTPKLFDFSISATVSLSTVAYVYKAAYNCHFSFVISYIVNFSRAIFLINSPDVKQVNCKYARQKRSSCVLKREKKKKNCKINLRSFFYTFTRTNLISKIEIYQVATNII